MKRLLIYMFVRNEMLNNYKLSRSTSIQINLDRNVLGDGRHVSGR